jgi:hypothetical protein
LSDELDPGRAPLIPDGPTGMLRRAKRSRTRSKPVAAAVEQTATARLHGPRARVLQFWQRNRTLFWALHSAWALAGGILVIVLAREQYGFVPWVVLFLGLTWLSTLYFGRSVANAEGAAGGVAGAAQKATSYVTRAMYQETLFFLLPFYAYSTVLGTVNVVFVVLLAGLAILSCIDLVFDRWLRESRVFSLLFFAVVAFAGINLLLPLLLPVEPTDATRIAGAAAMASAVPLALNGRRPSWRQVAVLTVTAAAFLAVAIGLPRVVPPVPLRLQSIEFASGIDRSNLRLEAELPQSVRTVDVPNGLYVRMQVFTPIEMPTMVKVRWLRDGKELRVSRDIMITASKQGFRVWDAWRPPSGAVAPGRYTAILETRERRAFGSASIVVEP